MAISASKNQLLNNPLLTDPNDIFINSQTAITTSETEDELKKSLMKLMIGDDLRIKVQYMEERSALNLNRPVNFKSLEQYFQIKYQKQLNIYYTTSSKDLMIQIKNQEELDHVIKLYDCGGSKRRMRLILSQKRDKNEKFTTPLLGIFHGITESKLSETSSILSQSANTSPSNRTNKLIREQPTTSSTTTKIKTPRLPQTWREGRMIGRGAYGQVYLCLNTETGEQLVVKKIKLRGSGRLRNRLLASLETEINLLGTLRHSNIVQYFGVQERTDCVNIFMEYMPGGSLKDQITDYGALSELNTINFTAQILSGLNYLHSKDIVHRDIKSANILRDVYAHLKIGDFGSAKCLQAICSSQGVDIIGTPHFQAPEIVRDSQKFDQKSDIWSVGITVIEMLTTKTPWWDVEPNAVHLCIAFEEPIYELPNEISEQLRNAIKEMLKMEPENRPNAIQLLKSKIFN